MLGFWKDDLLLLQNSAGDLADLYVYARLCCPQTLKSLQTFGHETSASVFSLCRETLVSFWESIRSAYIHADAGLGTCLLDRAIFFSITFHVLPVELCI